MKHFILSEVRPNEVSFVNKGAIKKKFVIMKNEHGQPEFKVGGGEEKMTIEEAIKLGLVDEKEAERLTKKEGEPESKIDSGVIKDLLATVQKMFVHKADAPPTPEEQKALDEKKKKDAETKKADDDNANEITKLKTQVDELSKSVAKSKEMETLLKKLSDEKDPKEFLKVLKEVQTLVKEAPATEDAQTKIVKVLDNISKRLETIELKSKGIDGQDAPQKKTSAWGGAFR